VSQTQYEIVTEPPGWKVLVGKWVHDFVVDVSWSEFPVGVLQVLHGPDGISTDFARPPFLPKSIIEE
jgi:hypothetical protein